MSSKKMYFIMIGVIGIIGSGNYTGTRYGESKLISSLRTNDAIGVYNFGICVRHLNPVIMYT